MSCIVLLHLLGVNSREVVGGPPAFSLAADLDIELFMFSLSSCGPLRLGSGVCGVEVCCSDTERFSLLGEIMLRCCRGPGVRKYSILKQNSI